MSVEEILGFVTGAACVWLAVRQNVWTFPVGLANNVVKPLLMRGDAELDGAVIFFALIGGLASFGAIGLLIGPLAVSLFLALLRIYRRDYQGTLAGAGAGAEARGEEPELPLQTRRS